MSTRSPVSFHAGHPGPDRRKEPAREEEHVDDPSPTAHPGEPAARGRVARRSARLERRGPHVLLDGAHRVRPDPERGAVGQHRNGLLPVHRGPGRDGQHHDPGDRRRLSAVLAAPRDRRHGLRAGDANPDGRNLYDPGVRQRQRSVRRLRREPDGGVGHRVELQRAAHLRGDLGREHHERGRERHLSVRRGSARDRQHHRAGDRRWVERLLGALRSDRAVPRRRVRAIREDAGRRRRLHDPGLRRQQLHEDGLLRRQPGLRLGHGLELRRGDHLRTDPAAQHRRRRRERHVPVPRRCRRDRQHHREGDGRRDVRLLEPLRPPGQPGGERVWPGREDARLRGHLHDPRARQRRLEDGHLRPERRRGVGHGRELRASRHVRTESSRQHPRRGAEQHLQVQRGGRRDGEHHRAPDERLPRRLLEALRPGGHLGDRGVRADREDAGSRRHVHDSRLRQRGQRDRDLRPEPRRRVGHALELRPGRHVRADPGGQHRRRGTEQYLQVQHGGRRDHEHHRAADERFPDRLLEALRPGGHLGVRGLRAGREDAGGQRYLHDPRLRQRRRPDRDLRPEPGGDLGHGLQLRTADPLWGHPPSQHRRHRRERHLSLRRGSG